MSIPQYEEVMMRANNDSQAEELALEEELVCKEDVLTVEALSTKEHTESVVESILKDILEGL